MRYAVRRLRRKMPQATILLGCWVADPAAAESLREAARADLVAATLRAAMALCIELATRDTIESSKAMTTASAA
jgi:hypothetical protein